MATLRPIPTEVAVDATCRLVFLGPANVAISWALNEGADGVISDASIATDSTGKATALYTPPEVPGTEIVTVTYGA